MAFIPKDEVQTRRGVAMQVRQLPPPNIKIGEYRDARIERESEKFTHGTFYLNTAMDASAPPPTKVKTFPERSANLNGNITAHCPPELMSQPRKPPHHIRAAGPRVADDRMEQYYRPQLEHERERQFQVQQVVNAPGFYEHFSLQREPKPAMRFGYTPLKTDPNQPSIPGLKNVGLESPSRHQGKKQLRDSVCEYDPLGFKSQSPPRATGMKRIPKSNISTVDEALHYNDGKPIEVGKPSKKPRAHRHAFEQVQKDDIPGLHGVGASDVPAPARSRKHLPDAEIDHHYANMERLRERRQNAATPTSLGASTLTFGSDPNALHPSASFAPQRSNLGGSNLGGRQSCPPGGFYHN